MCAIFDPSTTSRASSRVARLLLGVAFYTLHFHHLSRQQQWRRTVDLHCDIVLIFVAVAAEVRTASSLLLPGRAARGWPGQLREQSNEDRGSGNWERGRRLKQAGATA